MLYLSLFSYVIILIDMLQSMLIDVCMFFLACEPLKTLDPVNKDRNLVIFSTHLHIYDGFMGTAFFQASILILRQTC